MRSKTRPSELPAELARKLRAIRRRRLAVTVFAGLILSLAAFLCAMLASMMIDLAAGWFDVRARYASTLFALGLAAAAFVVWCLRPLARRRTIISTARDLEQSLPQLEERWSTVTELSEN